MELGFVEILKSNHYQKLLSFRVIAFQYFKLKVLKHVTVIFVTLLSENVFSIVCSLLFQEKTKVSSFSILQVETVSNRKNSPG